MIPIVGYLSDRYDRFALAGFAALALLALAYPLFYFLLSAPSLTTLLIVQGILGVLNATSLGCLGGLIAQLFPVALRSFGLSLSNAVTQMTIGGTTPFISVWLIEETGHPTAPAFYLMFAAVLSAVSLGLLKRRWTSPTRGF